VVPGADARLTFARRAGCLLNSKDGMLPVFQWGNGACHLHWFVDKYVVVFGKILFQR